MASNEEVTIEQYVNFKNKMQDYINTLDQGGLLKLFNTFKSELPTIQYTKNTNGYFMDIKQLSIDVLQKIEGSLMGQRHGQL